MTAINSKRQVASLLQERRRAMEHCRFKPENFNEIPRVLGARFAPDINRVVSKHRADAASAYMRRLQRDVERSQGGYYDQVHALPLQIKRLTVRREDPRNFKSVLIPKLKLSPVNDPTPSPRGGHQTASPVEAKSQSPVDEVPPLVVKNGSNYVPHKYFSPHSHTHIHVLFKQMPGMTSPRKGGTSSVVGSEISGAASTSLSDPKSQRSVPHHQQPLRAGTKMLSPREEVSPRMKHVQEEDPDSAWPPVDMPLPYTLPKFSASQAALPGIRKRITMDKSPRIEPRQANQGSIPLWATRKSEESSPVNQFSNKDAVNDGGLPASVAAALAADSSHCALHKMDLPADVVAAYDKNLPALDRPRPLAVSSNRGRLPPPSLPDNVGVNGQMLAIVSVQQSSAIQVAA